MHDALFKTAVHTSRDGIVISDFLKNDYPIVYVNQAFESLTGYSASEVLGKNCRFLQSPKDNHEREREIINHSLGEGLGCDVLLKNYRKDGTYFWNKLSLSPILDNNKLTHYIGFLKDITNEINIQEKLLLKYEKAIEDNNKYLLNAIHDPETGAFNRKYFENQFDIFLNLTTRNTNAVGLFLFDIDIDENTESPPDSIIKDIYELLLKYFKRNTDFICRFNNTRFLALCIGINPYEKSDYVNNLLNDVLELSLMKSKAETFSMYSGYTVKKYLDISSKNELYNEADVAISKAKKERSKRACSYQFI